MLFLQINSSQYAGVCLAGPEQEMLLLGKSRPCTGGKGLLQLLAGIWSVKGGKDTFGWMFPFNTTWCATQC